MKCSNCYMPFDREGHVPAFDAFSGRPVCDGCVRAQREARAAFMPEPQECCIESGALCHRAIPELRLAEVDTREVWDA